MPKFLDDALKIISEELPKFFTETNTPFLGKDEEESVMKEKSAGGKEKAINEALLKLGAAAPSLFLGAANVVKAAVAAPKTAALLTAAVTKDPTMLLPGGAGLLAQSNDAEAMVVPARLVHSSDEISKALGMLREGKNPMEVYNQGKKGTGFGGVYLGAKDNKIKTVISDEGADIANKDAEYLGGFLHHPRLFSKFQDLMDVKVAKIPEADKLEAAKRGNTLRGGYDSENDIVYYNPDLSPDELISTILHETQHAVQKRANFIHGSSVSASRNHPQLEPEFNKAMSKLSKNAPESEVDDALNDIMMQLYRRGAGEAEARATQTMFLKEGGNQYPFKYYDVDQKDLLLPAPNP